MQGRDQGFGTLTNRPEEAVGDCTNIHITYPALVAGYLFAFRANRDAAIVAEEGATGGPSRRQLAANDIAIGRGGVPDLKSVTRRRFWAEASPALSAGPGSLPYPPAGYAPRVEAASDDPGLPRP